LLISPVALAQIPQTAEQEGETTIAIIAPIPREYAKREPDPTLLQEKSIGRGITGEQYPYRCSHDNEEVWPPYCPDARSYEVIDAYHTHAAGNI